MILKMDKVTLIFSRKTDLAPTLWVVVPKKEADKLQTGLLTPELLKEMVETAGLKWQYWTEGMIQKLILGPTNQEPMEVVTVTEPVSPMGEDQLVKVLDEIEAEDNQILLEEPRGWDFTPKGVEPNPL